MILFDQLRISDDGSKMYINARVNKASAFDKVYIESITIMTSEKVSETEPGVPTSDYIYTKKVEGEEKELNLVLTSADFYKTWKTDMKAMAFNQSDMCNTLFFVYIKCKGTVSSDVPCRLDESTTLGVTFWENLLYRKVMSYTKELSNRCEIPTGFIDLILLWNSFKAAVETEHYIPAIKYYNLLFNGIVPTEGRDTVRRCGCYG